jgi:hypothetical protein
MRQRSEINTILRSFWLCQNDFHPPWIPEFAMIQKHETIPSSPFLQAQGENDGSTKFKERTGYAQDN